MKLGVLLPLAMHLSWFQAFVLATGKKDAAWAATMKHNKNDDASFGPMPASFMSPTAQLHEQRTVICPGPAVQNLYEGHVRLGHRTRLVVKNAASEPVVIAFVEHDGNEYSAANEGIQPAQSDPEAVLAPGTTKVFAANEGHVFHVRDLKTGELLAQHRTGLIPVENRYNQTIAACPTAREEERRVDDDIFRGMRKFPHWKPALIEKYNEDVFVDVGFKNNIQLPDGNICPVNIYYIKKDDLGGRRKPNYFERFTFHLGENIEATAGDGDLWDATIKYEKTYLGHEFVARLAHEEGIVVDHLVMRPVKVQDCGRKKQNDAVKSAPHVTAIVIPVGGKSALWNNATESSSSLMVDAFSSHVNTTESRRGFYFKLYTE